VAMAQATEDVAPECLFPESAPREDMIHMEG
jgi:hypothetical protein